MSWGPVLFGPWLLMAGLTMGCGGRDVLILDGGQDTEVGLADTGTSGGDDGAATTGDGDGDDGDDDDGGAATGDDGDGGTSPLPDASWGPPVVLSPAGVSAFGADVRLDGHGDAHAIWFQGSALVGASHALDMDAWSSHEVSALNVCPQPLELAFAHEGRGAIIWADGVYAPMMRFQRFVPPALGGEGWEPAQDLGINTSYVWSTRAELRDNDVLELVWIEGGEAVRIKSVDIDLHTGSTSAISTVYQAGADAWIDGIELLVGDDGGRLMTWTEGNSQGLSRMACYLNAHDDQGCAPLAVISEAPSAVGGESAGISLADGDLLVVYPGVDGPGLRYRARRFDVQTQTWGDEEDVTPVSTGAAYYPRLIPDALGGASLLWHQCVVDCALWAKRLDAVERTWSAEEWVADDTLVSYERPYAGGDDEGNLVVVWSASDGFRLRVYARHYDAAAGVWSGVQTLDRDSSYSSEGTVVAVNGLGQAMALWTELSADSISVLVGRRL